MPLKIQAHERRKASAAQSRVNSAYIQSFFADTNEELTCDAASGFIVSTSFPCKNMNWVGFVSGEALGSPYARNVVTDVNDIWGWTDSHTGKEYALVGMWDGTSIVDLSTPTQPRTVAFLETTNGVVNGLQGNRNIWRDMKVIGDVMYVGSEVTFHGIQTFDLTQLRSSPNGDRRLSRYPSVDRRLATSPFDVRFWINLLMAIVQYPFRVFESVFGLGASNPDTGSDQGTDPGSDPDDTDPGSGDFDTDSTPSAFPSWQPSIQPSSDPSSAPISAPTSSTPSSEPIFSPSSEPSSDPSSMPIPAPNSDPSADPSSDPSSIPITDLTSAPSSQPSSKPTSYPSSDPSTQPSSVPIPEPSSKPSSHPSSMPSSPPSATPSDRVPIVSPSYVTPEIGSSHNLVAATQAEKIIAVGLRTNDKTCPGSSFAIFDISNDPVRPEFDACIKVEGVASGYIHDAQCINYIGPTTAYVGVNICALFMESAIAIYDLDNRAVINSFTYANEAYVHQGWFSEDHTTLYVDDELDEVDGTSGSAYSSCYIFDMTDLTGTIAPPQQFVTPSEDTHPSVDHNLYTKDGHVYQAAYTSGARVRKILADMTLEEVAYFDGELTCECARRSGCGCDFYGGTWTFFPYFDSGLAIAGGAADGLFILRPLL